MLWADIASGHTGLADALFLVAAVVGGLAALPALGFRVLVVTGQETVALAAAVALLAGGFLVL